MAFVLSDTPMPKFERARRHERQPIINSVLQAFRVSKLVGPEDVAKIAQH